MRHQSDIRVKSKRRQTWKEHFGNLKANSKCDHGNRAASLRAAWNRHKAIQTASPSRQRSIEARSRQHQATSSNIKGTSKRHQGSLKPTSMRHLINFREREREREKERERGREGERDRSNSTSKRQQGHQSHIKAPSAQQPHGTRATSKHHRSDVRASKRQRGTTNLRQSDCKAASKRHLYVRARVHMRKNIKSVFESRSINQARVSIQKTTRAIKSYVNSYRLCSAEWSSGPTTTLYTCKTNRWTVVVQHTS